MIRPARGRSAVVAVGLAGVLGALSVTATAASAAGAHGGRRAPAASTTTTTLNLLPTYDLATAGGAVANFGGAGFYGQVSPAPLAAPVVGLAVMPDGHGYRLVASDGGIFS